MVQGVPTFPYFGLSRHWLEFQSRPFSRITCNTISRNRLSVGDACNSVSAVGQPLNFNIYHFKYEKRTCMPRNAIGEHKYHAYETRIKPANPSTCYNLIRHAARANRHRTDLASALHQVVDGRQLRQRLHARVGQGAVPLSRLKRHCRRQSWSAGHRRKLTPMSQPTQPHGGHYA